MKKIKLTDVQEIFYNHLIVLHDFFEENNLEYFIIGGTLLGAVRNSGFIPWDDDVDIAMPRKDYEQLIRIHNKLDNDLFEFSHYKVSRNFRLAHAYVYIKNTAIVSSRFLKRSNNFTIDIFPLDYLPDDNLKLNHINNKLNKYKLAQYIKEKSIKHSKSTSSRIKLLLAKIALFPFTKKFFVCLHDSYSKQLNNKITNRLGNTMGRYDIMKESISKDVYENKTLYQFGFAKLYGPTDFDKFLTNVYGSDYLIPKAYTEQLEDNLYFIDVKNEVRRKKRNK